MIDNTVEISEAGDGPGPGPGAILGQAREAKGLEVTAVAAMLHLSVSKLQALEADDYDSLPEPVFIRGYFNNYARLLDEPAAPVLDAYARYSQPIEIFERPPLEPHVRVEIGSGHSAVKFASIAIAALLIILPLAWWWSNLEDAVQKTVSTVDLETGQDQGTTAPETTKTEIDLSDFIPPPPPDSAETTKPVVSSLETEPPIEPPTLKVEESVTAGDTLSVPVPTTVTSGVQQTVSAIKAIVAGPGTGTEAEPVKLAALKRPAIAAPKKPAIKVVIRKPKSNTVAPAVGNKGAVLEFIESSWVKVRDANNQVILIGEYKKGQRKRLSGRTPYKVVLGDSTTVRVKIDGKVADLDRYSSGGVARFTIMDGRIQGP